MRFQYQGKAEPLSPLSAAPETITADKWLAQHPQPSRRRVLAAALLGAVVAPLVLPPTVTVDQWQPSASPVPRRAAPRHAGQYAVDTVRVPVEIDAWAGTAPTALRRSAPRQLGSMPDDPTGFARQATIDAWEGFDSPVPRRAAPRQSAGSAAIDTAPPALVRVDAWQSVWPHPQSRQRRQAAAAGVAPLLDLAAAVVVTVDSWQGAATFVPRRPDPRVMPTGGVVPEIHAAGVVVWRLVNGGLVDNGPAGGGLVHA